MSSNPPKTPFTAPHISGQHPLEFSGRLLFCQKACETPHCILPYYTGEQAPRPVRRFPCPHGKTIPAGRYDIPFGLPYTHLILSPYLENIVMQELGLWWREYTDSIREWYRDPYISLPPEANEESPRTAGPVLHICREGILLADVFVLKMFEALKRLARAALRIKRKRRR